MGEQKAVDKDVALLKKLHQATHAIKYMKKDGVNSQQGFKYLSAEQIVSEINRVLAEVGLYFAANVEECVELETGHTKNGGHIYRCRIKLRACVYDIDTGKFFEYYVYADGYDSGDKALGKAMTYGTKYAMRMIFSIETGENDPDKHTQEETKSLRKQHANKFDKMPADIKEIFNRLTKNGRTVDSLVKTCVELEWDWVAIKEMTGSELEDENLAMMDGTP